MEMSTSSCTILDLRQWLPTRCRRSVERRLTWLQKWFEDLGTNCGIPASYSVIHTVIRSLMHCHTLLMVQWMSSSHYHRDHHIVLLEDPGSVLYKKFGRNVTPTKWWHRRSPLGWVWRRVSSPQLTRGFEEHLELPSGVRAEPWTETHVGVCWRPQNVSDTVLCVKFGRGARFVGQLPLPQYRTTPDFLKYTL